MSTFTIKEKTSPKPQNIPNGEDDILLKAVLAYREHQARIAFETEALKPLREVIERHANAAPGGKIVTEQYAISLTPVERENFDKKAAIATLGRDKLAPFLSTTVFFQLRVK